MFVVCGEALMDVFAAGETTTGLRLDARVGGSPFNMAVGLARMGQSVCFLGAVSKGFLGDRLVKALAFEGVDARCVQRVEGPATLSLVGVDENGLPSYDFYGEGAADRQLPLSALDTLPPGSTVFQFGSYAMVVEPVAGTQRALIERVRGQGLIAYDPNVRLNVEPDVQRWREALAWMVPRTHLLKVSEEDAGLLFPGVALDVLATDWLAQGVELVVITRGSEGAAAWTASARAQSDAVRVGLIDTVGAGDTFQSALLVWLAERNLLAAGRLRGISVALLSQALAFAARAAAITCSRRGADLPYRQELP